MSMLTLVLFVIHAWSSFTQPCQSASQSVHAPRSPILSSIASTRHQVHQRPDLLLLDQNVPLQTLFATLPYDLSTNHHNLQLHKNHNSSLPLATSLWRTIQTLRQHSPSPNGSTLDPCLQNSDCNGIRYCINLKLFPQAPLCAGGESCVCLPPLPTSCNLNSQCDSNEVCAFYRNLTFPFCVSSYVEATNPSFRETPTNPAPSPRPGPLSGLTYDFCYSQSDCQAGRRCLQVKEDAQNDPAKACDGRDPCVCIPAKPVTCSKPTDCPIGEVCVALENRNVCISETTAYGIPELDIIRGPDVVEFDGSGWTLDGCAEASDCRKGRGCFRTPPSDGKRCPTEPYFSCRCYPFSTTNCTTDSDCGAGETCAIERDTRLPICMSKVAIADLPSLELQESSPSSVGPEVKISPAASTADTDENGTDGDEELDDEPGDGALSSIEPSPLADSGSTTNPETSTGVCIDAKALGHLGKEDLVFKESVLSTVLCDMNKSCATAGHMVMHKGKAMMMRTYCMIVRCTRQVMLVNSPRYRRGMRVRSNTEDLEFTVFAARYETRAEEMMLSAAVHIAL